MKLRHRPAIALLCLPLLLTGCSEDDEEPEAKPPATSAAVTTPSGTPTAEAWEEKSETGAQSFARHWVDAFNEAKRTGQTGSLRSMSSAGCQTCTNYADFLDELYEAGGRFESDGWDIKRALSEVDGNRGFVTLRITQSPEKVVRVPPEESEEFPGGPLTLTATVTWRKGNWIMERLDQLG